MNPTFVNAAGLRLRVSRTGQGHPLLLITGIGANLDTDARLHVIKGGGHLFLLDEPQSAAGRIRAFLDEPL